MTAADQTIPTSPPPGWEREVPKYRVTQDVQPPEKARFRLERPFSQILDQTRWQYAERSYTAGEIVETREWPHATFHGLNYSAQQVLRFFKTAPKSRLPRSPFDGDRLRLSDGLSNATAPKIGVVKPIPFDPRPAA
jgi:hypothetical protein